jgi:hypothetical protein
MIRISTEAGDGMIMSTEAGDGMIISTAMSAREKRSGHIQGRYWKGGGALALIPHIERSRQRCSNVPPRRG